MYGTKRHLNFVCECPQPGFDKMERCLKARERERDKVGDAGETDFNLVRIVCRMENLSLNGHSVSLKKVFRGTLWLICRKRTQCLHRMS